MSYDGPPFHVFGASGDGDYEVCANCDVHRTGEGTEASPYEYTSDGGLPRSARPPCREPVPTVAPMVVCFNLALMPDIDDIDVREGDAAYRLTGKGVKIRRGSGSGTPVLLAPGQVMHVASRDELISIMTKSADALWESVVEDRSVEREIPPPAPIPPETQEAIDGLERLLDKKPLAIAIEALRKIHNEAIGVSMGLEGTTADDPQTGAAAIVEITETALSAIRLVQGRGFIAETKAELESIRASVKKLRGDDVHPQCKECLTFLVDAHGHIPGDRCPRGCTTPESPPSLLDQLHDFLTRYVQECEDKGTTLTPFYAEAHALGRLIIAAGNEPDDDQPPCAEHDKVYDAQFNTRSEPLTLSWICRECGEVGVDSGVLVAGQTEYAAVMHRFQAAEDQDEAPDEPCHPECEAWRAVAVESNKSVDAYLRSIMPALPLHYGMPVDGVRKVIEFVRKGETVLLLDRKNACDKMGISQSASNETLERLLGEKFGGKGIWVINEWCPNDWLDCAWWGHADVVSLEQALDAARTRGRSDVIEKIKAQIDIKSSPAKQRPREDAGNLKCASCGARLVGIPAVCPRHG